MRAHEFTNKPATAITLRHLHKLKLIRRRRDKELAQKRELMAVMYGGGQLMDEDEHEQEKQALELLKDEIALEIEAAKIAQDDKDRIADMARRTLAKRLDQ